MLQRESWCPQTTHSSPTTLGCSSLARIGLIASYSPSKLVARGTQRSLEHEEKSLSLDGHPVMRITTIRLSGLLIAPKRTAEDLDCFS